MTHHQKAAIARGFFARACVKLPFTFRPAWGPGCMGPEEHQRLFFLGFDYCHKTTYTYRVPWGL